MDIKRLITHFTYRIEAKPGGGFIAHASDPTLPVLEAPTRFELNEKIRQNINTAMAAEFPELKSAMEQNQTQLSFHIERKEDGGFLLHSDDAGPTDAAPHEIESKFAEKLIAFAGKHFVPAEMSQALATNLASGNIKVFVTKTGGHSTGLFAGGAALDNSQAAISENSGALANSASEFPDPTVPAGTISDVGEGSPIHRNTTGNWGLLRFILALAILGAMAYFYLHHR